LVPRRFDVARSDSPGYESSFEKLGKIVGVGRPRRELSHAMLWKSAFYQRGNVAGGIAESMQSIRNRKALH